ncbi:MAG: PIG-L family deacetylase [Ornithinimicrobium sp.]
MQSGSHPQILPRAAVEPRASVTGHRAKYGCSDVDAKAVGAKVEPATGTIARYPRAMPSLRRPVSRLVRTLPEKRATQLRRTVRALGRRTVGGTREVVTYVVSPHPDDETLRLAGYVTRLRARTRGRLVLVAIGDGGASAVARSMGWSPGYEREFRRAEQAAAWSALTGGTGEIVRVGLQDNTYTAEEVRDALVPLNNKRARFIVAAHEQDYHSDHRAVVAGVRLLEPAYVRFALAPLMTGAGKVYKPSEVSLDAASIAVAAYKNFGQRSVVEEFRALVDSGYQSRVVEWSGETNVIQDPSDKPHHKDEALGRESRRTSDAAPVFVLGNQKSGTTAIAALLAECIDETFTSDVLYRNKLRLKDLLDENPSVAALADRRPEAFEGSVIKDNDFTFLYPSLFSAFPKAKFVFVVRDPRQNIRSVLNRLKLPGDLDSLSEQDYAQLKKKLPGWHTILTGSSFDSAKGHYIDELADRWVRANQVYQNASDHMTLVRYEDFDAAKRAVVEQLAVELGFSVVTDISSSQDRQYQPRGDRSITPEDFFGHENLDRIESRCAALMSSFGYEPSGSTRA